MKTKMINVRLTRPHERFNDLDNFIAWYEGEVAGSMGETEQSAILNLKASTAQPTNPAVHPRVAQC